MSVKASEDLEVAYRNKVEKAKKELSKAAGKVRLAKINPSNLFRYQPDPKGKGLNLDLTSFCSIHGLDKEKKLLTVEGLATYEQVVDHCLPQGYLPTVAPELMHITVGGALSGIGIESSCFRYGFVHDGLLEADVLLFTGDVVTCRADNAYADLFHALPNSYGTLGYIVKAVIRVERACPYVAVLCQEFTRADAFLKAMRQSCFNPCIDFVEGLFYDSAHFYLAVGQYQDEKEGLADIFHREPYYRQISRPNRFTLATKEYIFRYEPDWFWNVPEGGAYRLLRKVSPRFLRKSQYYRRYVQWKERFLLKKPDKGTSPVIQDWEVPWEKGLELIRYALEHVDLEGRPFAVVPILPQSSPTLYPVKARQIYLNLGSYCRISKGLENRDYAFTKGMDALCFSLGGIKMLYSSTFLSKEAFNAVYGGKKYLRLKEKYDPRHRSDTLYQKAVGDTFI